MGKKLLKASTLMAMPAFAALLALPLMNGMTASAANTAEDVPAFETNIQAMGDDDSITPYFGNLSDNKPMLFSASDKSESLPSSVDLSATPYFPEIGNQMGIGSCYAWSSAYYQYTYEANKLNNIPTTKDNAYSPAFVYNYRSSTTFSGGTCMDAYNFMMEHGCLRMGTMPYQSTNGASYIEKSNYDTSLSTDTDAMIDALETRIVGHDAITIPGTGTPITSPDDASLNELKGMLADGKIFSVRVQGFEYWRYANRKQYDETTGTASNYLNEKGRSESVCYRAIAGNSGHALTVVGYDDTVWTDINGNGTPEQGEYGAFKIANSWGTSYRNDGYTWVAYDALNKVSSVSGNWESNLSGSRIAIFDRGVYVNGKYNVNGFYFIEVDNKDVYYVAQVDVDTTDGVGLTVSLGQNENGSNNYSRTVLSNTSGSKKVPFDGTLAFDYADLCSPISDAISGYNWSVRLNTKYTTAAARITDNLSNTIVDLGEITDRYVEQPINLVMGDLNYDGQFTQADIEIKNSGAELSTLQQYLASDMPETPETPENPETPDVPETPETPDVPETPETPDVPETPETPDVPETPETPDVPETPETPETPDVPETPETPETPDVPETPATLIATASVVTEWDGGKIMTVTVKNTGNTPVNGWAFTCDTLGGEIVSIWNANLLSGNVVQCASYNATIPAGGEVTFGYQLANPNGSVPSFTQLQQNAAVSDCTVLVDIANAWDGGFVGYITIQNNSDAAINGFELTFTTEGFSITDPCGSSIVTNADGSYTLTSSVTIAAHSSIAIQFVGSTNGTPQIQVISMNTTALG